MLTNAPAASLIAAFRAAPGPRFSWRSRRTRSWRDTNPAATSAVRSLDPSSTTISSKSGQV